MSCSQDELRVAIIGAGPAGLFAAESLLRDPHTRVDVFDRLFAPYGLLRYGVAPDHPNIRRLVTTFARTLAHDRLRLFAGIRYGADVTLDELRAHYHGVIFATGAESDRRLDIPGEDLAGSVSATAFVGWYNGHPDHRELQPRLDHERVAVIGAGNVALDVARILLRTPDELHATDIAPLALERLAGSAVREVCIIARRGPCHTRFTPPEVRELSRMADAAPFVPADAFTSDPDAVEGRLGDRSNERVVELLRSYVADAPAPGRRTLRFVFCADPVAIDPDPAGTRCGALVLARNELYRDDNGNVAARRTGQHHRLEVGAVIRAIGYRGTPLPDLPFDPRSATIPEQDGRVTTQDGRVLPGVYVTGWARRGPTGVIGTNRPDAEQTITALLADVAARRVATPPAAELPDITALLDNRCARWIDRDRWARLEAIERATGERLGRPSYRITSADDAWQALATDDDPTPRSAHQTSTETARETGARQRPAGNPDGT